jgi:hypothetical protein
VDLINHLKKISKKIYSKNISISIDKKKNSLDINSIFVIENIEKEDIFRFILMGYFF